jgi:hypothetical protein
MEQNNDKLWYYLIAIKLREVNVFHEVHNRNVSGYLEKIGTPIKPR